jgi:xylulokinase
MEDNCVLGVDVGTSGFRVIALDEQGKVVASATEEYQTIFPHPGWAEQTKARESTWRSRINVGQHFQKNSGLKLVM